MSGSYGGRAFIGRACASVAMCLQMICAWAAGKPDHPTQVYWGDTHLHTNLSADAFFSGTTLTPEDAYRFARGETVTRSEGAQRKLTIKLRRPLDFLAVADHAENLGSMVALEAGDPDLLASESGARWHEKLQKALPALGQIRKSRERLDTGSISGQIVMEKNAEIVGGVAFRRSVWDGVARRADRYNDPGKFTAFSGYEWTPLIPDNFIHRVVLFRDDAATVSQLLPFTAQDSTRPEDLWAHLETYSRKTGGEVLAIPHNSNLTFGHMFMLEDSDGKPLTRDYARLRSRWEPLLEVTQLKGDSETHPELSPTDEFADFERPKPPWRPPGVDRGRRYEYARSALKLGLDRQAVLGANPFKFGMIGSTDAHGALSTTEKSHFKAVHDVPPSWVTAARSNPTLAGESYIYAKWNLGGRAAVWATENTREALFAAMKRREVYATTGSRIELRFFGGWAYTKADAARHDLTHVGYAKGVPMGSDLTHRPRGKAPSFLIRAVKDPDGPNLDRVQVIKGWRDAQGETHEKIYHVVLSDGRKEDRNGRVPPVGSTVDVKGASYVNSIGDPELAAVWTDPDFHSSEPAFYYARVIEIPSPRWTAYFAKQNKMAMPSEIPMVAQERAYSSPIWYSPPK